MSLVEPKKPELEYPFKSQRPEFGEPFQVADGIYWLRMPLDLTGLDHINLWLLRDGEGWTLVDTGMNSERLRQIWTEVMDSKLEGLPITRIICTHFHPDHLGLAAWIQERFPDCKLWMTRGEWTFGRMLFLQQSDKQAHQRNYDDHFRRTGFPEEVLTVIRERGSGSFSDNVYHVPNRFRRIKHGDSLQVGAHRWQVVMGNGHSPEHACLYCPELNILISGDQVLPRITPHIGVYPEEPEGNPLQDYMDSLERLLELDLDPLVLPAHGDVFTGLKARLEYLLHHHVYRLEVLKDSIVAPIRVFPALKVMFGRRLKDFEIFLGVAETIAHFNCLIEKGVIIREADEHGVWIYRPADRQSGAEAA